jgi:hypothetical protein
MGEVEAILGLVHRSETPVHPALVCSPKTATEPIFVL